MLRDPLAVQKKFLPTTCGPKMFRKTRKTPLEPLDLLATVGQSCVRVSESVSVLMSVCVCLCVWRRTTLQRRDVEVSEKNYLR